MKINRLFIAVAFTLLLAAPSQALRGSDGQTVNIGVSHPLHTVNSLAGWFDSGAEALKDLLFDTLVIRDENLEYVGHLASSFELSTDGTVLTFRLRDDVEFHNGQKLQAKDVKYSIDELISSDGYRSSAFFETVDGRRLPRITAITIPNEHTVVLTLRNGVEGEFVVSLLPSIPIIPFGTVHLIETKPIGSGPFRFMRFDGRQQVVELSANEKYWDGRPTVTRVAFKGNQSPETIASGLRDNSLDIVLANSYLDSSFYNLLVDQANIRTIHFPGTDIRYLSLNTASRRLKDPRIRKAIAYAIDRPGLVDAVTSGRAVVAHSPLPPQSLAYTEGVRYDYDPDSSRQLLKAADYRGETLTLSISEAGDFRQVATNIVQMLSRVGIAAKVVTLNPSQLRTNLMAGEFELHIGTWIGGNRDARFLEDLFSSKRIPDDGIICCNRSRFSDSGIDRLFRTADGTRDVDRKRRLYKDAWIKISDKVPMLPLYHPPQTIVANRRISNIRPGLTGGWRFIRNLQVE